MALWMASPPRARRSSAASLASIAVAVAVVAAVAAASSSARASGVAAAVPVAAGGVWAAAAEAVRAAVAPSVIRGGALPVLGRPLTDGVSVVTNGTYMLLNASEALVGCPVSLSIASPLATDNGTFLVPPASLTANGGGCTGVNATTGLVGLFGDALVDAANRTGQLGNLTELLEVDPQAAVAVVISGPITCGEVVFEDATWTFLVAGGVPVLVLTDGVDPTVGCTLADVSNRVPTAPTPPPATIRLDVPRGVPVAGGGEPANMPESDGM